MRAILLPIKNLSNAKQRLSPLLSPEDRRTLAQAMLTDVVRVLGEVRNADKIFVVTNSVVGMEAAKNHGWEVIQESDQISESASVDAASRLCQQAGVTALLRLPLDLPLIRASDVDVLLGVACSPPAAVVVPSRDGTGTNAILRTPPQLFPSHFGPGSFSLHSREARKAGAELIVHRNPRIEFDVDDPADIDELLTHDLNGTETGRWLHAYHLGKRRPLRTQERRYL